MKIEVTHTKTNIKEVIKNVTKLSNLEIGVAIASQAKTLAPVDQGQLRNSLSATSLRGENKLLNDHQGEQAEPLDRSGLKNDEVYVGSNSDHAIFQEFGTIKAVAQPFLRPAEEIITQGSRPADIYAKFSREQMEKELKERKEKLAEVANG